MPKRNDIPRITLSDGKKIFNIIKNKLPFSIYLAGSARREEQYINDMDIIVVPNQSNDLLYISNILNKIERNGKKIISGIYYYNNKPILIDFFVSTKKELPYSLLQYTGPKSYNIRIRKYVKDKHGWLLNQYGLFYANDTTIRVKGSGNLKSEKDVIKFIGTNYYHPRDRL